MPFLKKHKYLISQTESIKYIRDLSKNKIICVTFILDSTKRNYAHYNLPLNKDFNLILNEKKKALRLVSRQFIKELQTKLLDNNHKLYLTSNGKIKVKSKLPFSISISYCNNQITIAFSKNNSLGVDIEKIDEKKFLKLIKLPFNKSENEIIKKSRNKINEFFRIWCLKEAIVKQKNLKLINYLKRRLIKKNDKKYVCLLDGSYLNVYIKKKMTYAFSTSENQPVVFVEKILH